MSILSDLRQFLYPREFRITTVKAFDLTTILKVIANLPDKGISETISDESLRFLVDLSLSLWRLHQKMLQPETGQPLKEMGYAYNALTSVWNSLIQAEVTIRDYTNLPYDSSLALSVVSYQELSGITEPKIIETIKPTVYLQGDPIQIGEVVVGIPPGTN